MIKKILITALCSVAAIFGAAAYSLSANATTVEDVMAEARYWGYPESMILKMHLPNGLLNGLKMSMIPLY